MIDSLLYSKVYSSNSRYYTKFGKSALSGVNREDLYQMTTYLHHYGKEDQSIIGLFTSPVHCSEDDVHAYSHNKNHRIGLVNLDVESVGDNIELLHKNEQIYLDNITKILASL